MDLTPYISNLREDLAATASAGDDHTRRAAALLSGALEPAVRLAIMNALADFAAETTASLPDYVVEVRLDGRDVRVVVTGNGSSEPAPRTARNDPPPAAAPPIDGGDISRMTLRLVEQIKGRAEQAAAAQGVSLNTFISHAVQGALGQGSFKGGGGGWESKSGHGNQSDTRLHGWVRG
ncbi:MAG: hypothetical protein QOI21_5117 [Actinomycetota bacterium]|jgi:hypothetical protein|nr:hypothetical protein [Actinomycetota bacterium]